MDRKDFRSLLSKFTGSTKQEGAAPARLLRRVGQAIGFDARPSRLGFEALESRQLLEGSFASVLTDIALDVSGRGSTAGSVVTGANVINPAQVATDNDWYSFTAAATDFVTVLADTSNENPASSLNTRIEVYDQNQLLVAQGTNNGILTSGTAHDGWAGFIAQAGQVYKIKVSSDYPNPKPNLTANNTYSVRVVAASTPVDIGGELAAEKGIVREFGSPLPDDTQFPPVGITPVLGQLGGTALPVTDRLRQDNIVYKLVVPAGVQYNDFITINAQSTDLNLTRRLDTRIDVYNSQGVLIVSDSDTGRINDAFATVRANPGDVYYIRVRSDEIRSTNIQAAAGPFFLVVDALTDQINLDPVSRTATLAGGMFGFIDPTVAASPNIPNPRFQTHSFEFTSLGSGLSIISLTPRNPPPQLADGALRLYNDAGDLVAFNNNFSGLNPQISAILEGGKRYFLVVDGFELNTGTNYNLTVESNTTQNNGVDDHVNTPTIGSDSDFNVSRRAFELATALIWGSATPVFDGFGNVIRDHGLLTSATGRGRIEGTGDTDLFQFVPQVSMMGDHAGNNDDAGTALFVGGAFDGTQEMNPWPTITRSLGVWDAADWFAVGDQRQQGPDLLGFQDNPDTVGTSRAEIYALYDWDLDPETEPADGFTDNVLVVGGDFDLKFNTPQGVVTAKNFAIWIQDPASGNFGWLTLGDTDGPVRAITAYDPVEFDSNGSLPDGVIPDPNDSELPQLFIGGSFTDVGSGTAANNIAFFDLNTGWNAMGTGANGTVHALTTYDFDDPAAERVTQPGPPAVRQVNDTPDRPISLIVGGQFTNTGGVAAGNISAWNGNNWENLGTGRINATAGAGNGGVAPVFNLNGPVFSLAVFDSGDPDGDAGPFEAPANGVLYIGGRFTQVNGGVVNQNGGNVGPNLVAFGYTAVGELANPNNPLDPAADVYNPRLVHGNFGLSAGVANETVLALAVWDPPDIAGTTIDPFLAVGGDLTSVGFIGITDGINPVGTLSGGASGIVRAIATLNDEQAPDISETITSGAPQEVLYIGGDFVSIFDADGNEFDALHVAQFSAHNLGQGDFFEWVTPLNTGEPNITAAFGFPGVNSGVFNTDPNAPAPTVFSLASFDDGNPLQWDRHDRRSTRLQIVLSPQGASFLNTRVRVLDSNFEVIYDFDRPGSETIAPPQQDPSGMINGALQTPPNAPGGGFNVDFEGIQVWAGETYYIEVSGTGTGRYSFTVTAAAAAEDLNGDGRQDDVNSQVREEPDEGQFSAAFGASINTTLLNGDGTNYRQSATQSQGTPPNGNSNRTFHVTPSINDVFTEGYDLGNIHNRDDVDIYSFRAEFDGYAEIRLDTWFLATEFGFSLQGTHPDDFEGIQKVINSNLDAALRIFRNDFVQIGYNDDNYAVQGDFVLNEDADTILTGGTRVGTIGGTLPQAVDGTTAALFTRRDPRVVIPVIAGNFYFVQIESGQKWANGREEDIDARVERLDREREARADHGAYRLIINQMPSQQAEIVNGQQVLDDHFDEAQADFATPIPIGDNPDDSATNGRGSITGVIRNTPLNPVDIDQFTFFSPGEGRLRIDIRPTGTGNNLQPQFGLFRFNAQGAIENQTVATGAPLSGGGVTATIDAAAGDKFILRVIGQGNSQGAYRIDISGVPVTDDHADALKFNDATEIQLFDFQGIGNASGNIENPGDSDVFKFRVNDFNPFTFTVTGVDDSLQPRITIYEVGEDNSGNPILLRIADAQAGAAGGDIAVSFPVTPNRVVRDNAGNIIREYPYYYAVIKDANPIGGVGRYNIAVNFEPTDDHADGDPDQDGTLDDGEFDQASTIALDSNTGQGNSTGIIEVASDSDLFSFTSPAGGSASVVISRPSTSTIRTRVSILDADANVIATATADDSTINGTAIVNFSAVRGTTYFVVVEGFEDPNTPNVNTTNTGSYTVSVIAPPVDDFPNADEFSLADAASNIPIVFSTGVGRIGGTAGGDPLNPRFEYAGDSDLFTFTTIRAGNVVITMRPFDTGAGRIAPSMRIYDAQRNLILTSAPAGRLETITLTITGAAAGAQYYILTDALEGVTNTTETGEYSLTVAGPASSGGEGNTPEEIDFSNPTTITLNSRTGDGSASDNIEVINDRDLFKFTTTAAGKVFVQLSAGNGSLLRASISIYNAANELVGSQVAFDSDGIPGAIAYVTFDGEATTDYYIVVDGLGDSVGSYTVKVNTQPLVNQLVYPEGYANANVREFVSIVNPNDTPVTYTVILRYETGELETVIATRTIRANARNGVTIIDPSTVVPGIRLNTPYAIIINSSLPLGATMAHYDFGNSIGDSFTETTSATYHFARVEKDPAVADFVVFYNPNNFDVFATLTANVDGVSNSTTVRFGANRRGGFAINDTNFPVGVYGVTLTVRPVDSSNDSAFIGVVAALSHYNLVETEAFGLLGDSTGGATEGVITNIAQGSTITSEVNFYNPGTSPATVTLTGSYIRTSLPSFTRTIQVPAKSSIRLTGDVLGLAPDQPVGLTYTSNVPIVASSTERQNGDSDSTNASTVAANQVFFGDAYIDSRFPGLQEESLYFYNPGSVANNISVVLRYADRNLAPDTLTISVPAGGFREIQLHQLNEIINKSATLWFGIDAFSDLPFVANMVHYDLALSGGFATSGVAYGITTPLNKIS